MRSVKTLQRCYPYVLGLLLCVPALAQETADPVVLSERVGPVIDAEERAYFQLLPDFEPFIAARAFPASGGGVRLVIERAGASDAILTLNGPTTEALRTYLDEYESMTPERVGTLGLVFQGVAEYEETQPPATLTVTTRTGAVYRGWLMDVNEDGVILWTQGERYTPDQAETAVAVHVYEIDRVSTERLLQIDNIGYWARWGAPVVGAVAYTGTVLSKDDGADVRPIAQAATLAGGVLAGYLWSRSYQQGAGRVDRTSHRFRGDPAEYTRRYTWLQGLTRKWEGLPPELQPLRESLATHSALTPGDVAVTAAQPSSGTGANPRAWWMPSLQFSVAGAQFTEALPEVQGLVLKGFGSQPVTELTGSQLALVLEGSVQVSGLRVGFEQLRQDATTSGAAFVDHLNTTVTTPFIGVDLPLAWLVEGLPIAVGVDWGFSRQETSAVLQPDGYGVFFRANYPDAPELFIQDGSAPDDLQEQAIAAEVEQEMRTLRFHVRYQMTSRVSAYVRYSKAAESVTIPRRRFTPSTGVSANTTLFDIAPYTVSADYFAFGFRWRLL